MIDPYSQSLTISLLSSERTASADRVTLTVRELCESLCEYQERESKSGGAWSPILWADDTRASERAESVSCLVYDLDSATPAELESLGVRLDATGWIHAIHETYTAGRFRLVLPLACPLAPAAYGSTWERVRQELAVPGVDETGRDLARLFFLPAKPSNSERLAGYDGYALLDAARYDTYVAVGKPSESQRSPSPSAAEKADFRSENASENFLPLPDAPVDLESMRLAVKASSLATEVRRGLLDAIDQRLVLKKGERENQLHRLTCGMVSAFPEGTSKDAAEAAVEAVFTSLVERMERDDNETTEYFLSRVGSSFDRAWEHREERLARRRAVREAAEKFLKPAEGDPEAWRGRLLQQSTKEGPRVKACTSNLDLILENDDAFKGHLAFNELTRVMEFYGGALAASNLSTVGLELSNWLQTSAYGLDMSETICGRALLLSARRHAKNPVAEYLEGLVWDGVPRIHKVLTDMCGAEGNKGYVQDVTRKFFISAAARGLEPGCKVDTVLVLQGPQGTRKTSLVECLAGDWYTTVSGKTDDKDTRMQATSAWFVELSELASMAKGTVESLRGFITQRLDHIRLPYAAAHEEFARRCVFVGTTNSEQPLIDQEGNRRFWVVTCGRIDIQAIEKVRDQLWAEAVWSFRQWQQERANGVGEEDMKFRWWLLPHEQDIANEENSIYQAENPMESDIALWLAQQDKPLHEINPMTVTEVAKKCLGMTSEMLARDVTLIQRVGRTLGQLGWVKVRIRRNGKRTWAYQPKEPLTSREE